MSQRLAYLMPEFPNQAHSYIWREIRELRRRGERVDLVSTQVPQPHLMCHDWSAQAREETTYLIPLGVESTRHAIGALTKGVAPIARSLRVIAHADLTMLERLRRLPVILVAAKLAGLARERGWTHVHVHSCGWCAEVARLAHALSALPYSLTLHGPGVGDSYGKLQREKWDAASFGLVVSAALRDKLRAEVPDVASDKIAVVSMGVDTSAFVRSRPLVLPPADAVWRIVSCGRLKTMKGHEHLLRAIAQLRSRGVHTRLSILGEGSERPIIERLIANLQLNDIVTLAGAVSEDRVRQELDAAHLFALASLDEAIGVATMEAMAMQLPVVVTDVGGVRELVRNGVDGYLVPPADPAAIADAIVRIVDDPVRATEMGRTGSQRVAAEFGSERSAIALLDMLKRQGTRRLANDS
jgi:glycosyltransferase involved in cell wall biosynthesis